MKILDELVTCFTKLPMTFLAWWAGWIIVGVILFFASLHKCRQISAAKVHPSPAASPVSNEKLQVIVNATPITVNIVTGEVRNKEGKVVAKFEASILSQECYWAYSSTTDVLINGKPIDMKSFFESGGLQSRFNEAVDVIAIGTASEEGDAEREYKRSIERANQLIHWLRQSITKPSVSFWTFSLGKYEDAENLSKDESAYQRSIVVVRVFEKSEDINLLESLVTFLTENKDLPFPLSKYLKRDLKKVG